MLKFLQFKCMMSAPDFQIVSPNTHIEKRQILKNISNC